MRSTWIMLAVLAATPAVADDYQSELPETQRPWIGPEFWANPLQDWQLNGGRIECHVAGGDRNVYLLTHSIENSAAGFELSVDCGPLDAKEKPLGWVGFRIGVRGYFDDYRDSAVRGFGLNCGVTPTGVAFLGKPPSDAPSENPLRIDTSSPFSLKLTAMPIEGDRCLLTLIAQNEDGAPVTVDRRDLDGGALDGGIALVCSSAKLVETPIALGNVVDPQWGGKPRTKRGGAMRFWFRDFRVSGLGILEHAERTFGPIFFTQHTLSRGSLKLTAQLPPVGADGVVAHLDLFDGESWSPVATAQRDPLACTATFRVEGYARTKPTRYRVRFELSAGRKSPKTFTYEGTIRPDPKDQAKIVVAAFTGNNDLGFPHADIVRNVQHFRPDMLVFTGDQLYERVGEYGIQRKPLATATLDYLRKWMIYGWEYGELLRNTPSLAMTDDHDVYHGNIWGAGGISIEKRIAEGYATDNGGYRMPATWVNVVQRTQTSHMPDSPDPTPVAQGIGVYYCDVLYGGISFAVLEDRKWKSAPSVVLPEARIVNGWIKNPEFDMTQAEIRAKADAKEAVLLGQRQLDFLESWANDWSGGAEMKCVCSQTIFANVATLPPPADNDAVTPRLKVWPLGGYPDHEVPVTDFDSNSWPQSKRNAAVDRMRRGFAVHIAGDQHLGSTIQYGVDSFRDAGFALCVPSVANVWPRRWFPSQPGGNRAEGSPRYSGDYLDGFGNRMTVHAVSNPHIAPKPPHAINDRAPGFGIAEFDKSKRAVTFTNWPRWVDVTGDDAKPYDGWPITIQQRDNGPKPTHWLTRFVVRGMENPVVQIKNAEGKIIYTIREQYPEFDVGVYDAGVYSVGVGEPGTERWKVIEDLRARTGGAPNLSRVIEL